MNPALKPARYRGLDVQWKDLPSWRDGSKGGDRHSWIVPHNPIQYAFRSAGLIRSKKPFALLVDDIQKDDVGHNYTWQLQMPDDVQEVGKEIARDGSLRLTLGDEQGRRLLIVAYPKGLIKTSPQKALEGFALEDQSWVDRGNTHNYKRVALHLEAVKVNHRVFLFPYAEGDTLPLIRRSEDKGRISVKWAGEINHFDFSVQADGRTTFDISGQAETVSVR